MTFLHYFLYTKSSRSDYLTAHGLFAGQVRFARFACLAPRGSRSKSYYGVARGEQLSFSRTVSKTKTMLTVSGFSARTRRR